MSKAPSQNLRSYLTALRQKGLVADVYAPVDARLELAEIHRRIAAANGPTLFFHTVVGSCFPVVTNLFGSEQHIDIAFGKEPLQFVQETIDLFTRKFPPSLKQLWQHRKHLLRLSKLGSSRCRLAPVLEKKQAQPDLEKLPLLQLWPEDGGAFITLPLVYTEPLEAGPPNLGIYRMQRYDQETTGMHWQIAKGGGFHHYQAETKKLPLPVSVFIGGPPALMLSAIAPLPENVPELLLASLLQQKRIAQASVPGHPHPLIAQSEFALLGQTVANERRAEGPFGDHYGYYSLQHPFPVFRCKAVYHRKDAIYPATVVGKPRQEDFYLGNYLQKLLSPLFPVVMPGVRALWSYGETGFHSLSSAVVQERYYRECMSAAFRILGEGQLSLTKFLLLTDQLVDLHNFPLVLQTVLERFQPETDLFIFSNLSMDTLDYTGPELNKGSRGVLLGLGEKRRDLPETFLGPLPLPLKEAVPFCPGCLVVEGPSFTQKLDLQTLLAHESLANWPLVILVDSCRKATKNIASFLWTVFTRFEPAADIHSKSVTLVRHHISYSLPILIDARTKPSYPSEVFCDAKTAEKVTKRWEEYFPQGMPMGDSDLAHI